MSLEFVRLDTSIPCDSHAIVMRKECREAALPERTWRDLCRKTELGRVQCYRPRGCCASTRRSQSDGGFWNDCPRVLALTCIHDIFPVIDGQNFLPIQPYRNKCLVLLRKPEPINFLVLPCEVSALDPERHFFLRDGFRSATLSNPLHQSKASSQTNTCLSAWDGPQSEATIRTHLLFTQEV